MLVQYSFVRLSSISCTWGHDLAPGLVLSPLHKKTSRIVVSTMFRTPFVHIWPKLSFPAPAQVPLQNGRINTASCDVPFISCTEGHDLAPGLVLNPSHKKQFHNGRFVWLASISRNQSHYLAPGLVLYPLHKNPFRMTVSTVSCDSRPLHVPGERSGDKLILCPCTNPRPVWQFRHCFV